MRRDDDFMLLGRGDCKGSFAIPFVLVATTTSTATKVAVAAVGAADDAAYGLVMGC